MSENQRYVRQTCLPAFGADGQAKLEAGRVLIVGLGGLGLPVANYLNAMGVGKIGLVEQDTVELHNLQRQVFYSENDIGKPKIEVALQRLEIQNSTTSFEVFDTFLTKENALQIIKDFDVVVDATDNFPTRYLINDACVILNKPIVYGALHGFEGQVSVLNHENGPTYRCLFPVQPTNDEIPNCDENGVLGIIPGIVGTLQALEAVKVLTGIGETLSGKLLLYDGLAQATRKINFPLKLENKRITELQESYDFTFCSQENLISMAEVVALLKTDNPLLIDVRSEKEFKHQNLEGSINIPLNDLANSIEKIDFGQPIYLICQSGKRAATAYEQLKRKRPDASLMVVSGGMANLSSHV